MFRINSICLACLGRCWFISWFFKELSHYQKDHCQNAFIYFKRHHFSILNCSLKRKKISTCSSSDPWASLNSLLIKRLKLFKITHLKVRFICAGWLQHCQQKYTSKRRLQKIPDRKKISKCSFSWALSFDIWPIKICFHWNPNSKKRFCHRETMSTSSKNVIICSFRKLL